MLLDGLLVGPRITAPAAASALPAAVAPVPWHFGSLLPARKCERLQKEALKGSERILKALIISWGAWSPFRAKLLRRYDPNRVGQPAHV